MTTSLWRGMSTSMFLRLWTRAPRTAIQSWAMLLFEISWGKPKRSDLVPDAGIRHVQSSGRRRSGAHMSGPDLQESRTSPTGRPEPEVSRHTARPRSGHDWMSGADGVARRAVRLTVDRVTQPAVRLYADETEVRQHQPRSTSRVGRSRRESAAPCGGRPLHDEQATRRRRARAPARRTARRNGRRPVRLLVAQHEHADADEHEREQRPDVRSGRRSRRRRRSATTPPRTFR